MLVILVSCGPNSSHEPLAPAAPTSVTVQAHPGFNRVEWQHAGGTGLSGFRVYRSVQAVGVTAQARTSLGDVGANDRQFDDATAQPGTIYNYSVSALGAGRSESAPAADPEPGVPTLPEPDEPTPPEPDLLITVGDGSGAAIQLPTRRSTLLPVTINPVGGFAGEVTVRVRAAEANTADPLVIWRLDDFSDLVQIVDADPLELMFGAWVLPLEGEAGVEYAYELLVEDAAGASWRVPLAFAVVEGAGFELTATPERAILLPGEPATIQIDYPVPPDGATALGLTAHPLEAYAQFEFEDSFHDLQPVPAAASAGSARFEVVAQDGTPPGKYPVSFAVVFGTVDSSEVDGEPDDRFTPQQWDWVEVVLEVAEPVSTTQFHLLLDKSLTEAKTGLVTEIGFTLVPIGGYEGNVHFDILLDTNRTEVDLSAEGWIAELDGQTPLDFTISVYPWVEEPGHSFELELRANAESTDETASDSISLTVAQGPVLDLEISPSDFNLVVGGDAMAGEVHYPTAPAGATHYGFGAWPMSSEYPHAYFDWHGPFEPVPLTGGATAEFTVSAPYREVRPGAYGFELMLGFMTEDGTVIQWDSVPVAIQVSAPAEGLNARLVTTELSAPAGGTLSAPVLVDLPDEFTGELEFHWLIGDSSATYHLELESVSVAEGGVDTPVELLQELWPSIPAGEYPRSQLWVSLASDPDVFSVLTANVEVMPDLMGSQ